jgi:hypothetical protein
MRCKISAAYYEEQDALPPEERESFPDTVGGYRRAITLTDLLLDSLERRAMDWDGVDFNNSIMLTRGANFSIAGPLVGFLGYSLMLDCSATVQSLIESRKRFEIQRAILCPRSRMSWWYWCLSKTMFSKTEPQIEKVINPDNVVEIEKPEEEKKKESSIVIGNSDDDDYSGADFSSFNTGSVKIKRYNDYDPRKEKNLMRELTDE